MVNITYNVQLLFMTSDKSKIAAFQALNHIKMYQIERNYACDYY